MGAFSSGFAAPLAISWWFVTILRPFQEVVQSRLHAGIAQLAEQRLRKARVGGSNPLSGTISKSAGPFFADYFRSLAQPG